MRAVVVFSQPDDDLRWFSRFLKRGFGHVCVVVLAGDYWISIDGGLGIPVIKVETDGDFDLAAHYRTSGCTVLEVEQRGVPIRAPYFAANCVGLVKAVLCVRSFWTLTPWALYQYLRRKPK